MTSIKIYVLYWLDKIKLQWVPLTYHTSRYMWHFLIWMSDRLDLEKSNER